MIHKKYNFMHTSICDCSEEFESLRVQCELKIHFIRSYNDENKERHS